MSDEERLSRVYEQLEEEGLDLLLAVLTGPGPSSGAPGESR